MLKRDDKDAKEKPLLEVDGKVMVSVKHISFDSNLFLYHWICSLQIDCMCCALTV